MLPWEYSMLLVKFNTSILITYEPVTFEQKATRISSSMQYTLCSKKVTPKFKSLQLQHILSELNILLVALISIFPTQTLQISTKSTAQFLSNSCWNLQPLHRKDDNYSR